ncbi:hypothetical protein M3O96_18125 [Aquiflexum sp. TKW24L]|uniref:hypothetical protein n=1 Tax=Aquiflexum sp. TKW24L TaxID=2942212 RepID=UPI0020BD95D7|nr:hypothetical protein [Aquiflexum sp. TKW24L]MCL6261027.1 hypothetical protein [Aquiflexum sp. TKW24L]
MKTIEKIEKEKIDELRFSKKEVLEDEKERKIRNFELMRAQAIGNLLRSKSTITFEDANGKTFQINTTVWAVGDKFVSLKCNRHIPINAILVVD